MPDKKVKSPKSKVRSYFFGYSLIELLIVISIFGITVSLVTASYLTFERNQRFKNAALQIKSDIRYAQNKAVAGDKSLSGCLASSTTLLGWYVNIVKDASSYSLYSDCRDATGTEVVAQLNGKSLTLPVGVTICSVQVGSAERTNINVLFQPLTAAGTFHTGSPTTPAFFNADGVTFKAQLSGSAEIYLKNASSACFDSGTYKVVVQPNGEVNEVKL